jgi:hypothetical protein
VIDCGWPQRVGDQNLSTSTQPVGVGAPAQTSITASIDLSEYVSIVHKLYVMPEGLPQLVGDQSSSIFIHPLGTGLFAQICITRLSTPKAGGPIFAC